MQKCSEQCWGSVLCLIKLSSVVFAVQSAIVIRGPEDTVEELAAIGEQPKDFRLLDKEDWLL